MRKACASPGHAADGVTRGVPPRDDPADATPAGCKVRRRNARRRASQ
jgi:hypothetical protein